MTGSPSKGDWGHEPPVPLVPLLARILAFGLNILIFGYSWLLVFLLIVVGPVDMRSGDPRMVPIWVSAVMALAVANIIGLAVPCTLRMFSLMRLATIFMNIVAAIFFIYLALSDRSFTVLGDRGIDAVFFFCLAGATITALAITRLRNTQGTLLCEKCGYDLRGTVSDRCPECGWRREAAS